MAGRATSARLTVRSLSSDDPWADAHALLKRHNHLDLCVVISRHHE